MNYILLLYLFFISVNTFRSDHGAAEKAVDKKEASIAIKRASIPLAEWRYHETYSFVRHDLDTISHANGLSLFYEKLYELKSGQRKRVSIVQIGDSHIQPDLISREVRIGLQRFFGDAGRGLVFPYQVARTNGPQDIRSSAPTRWLSSTISQLRSSASRGISGFTLSRHNGAGNFQLYLKPDIESGQQSFDYIRLFVGQGAWQLDPIHASGLSYPITASSADTAFRLKEIQLSEPSTGFTMHALTHQSYFFGASLEKQHAPGVLFHTIGVNGARYAQYNESEMFWKQLPSLQADLYILSMGTNESLYNTMTTDLYIHDVAETIAKIKAIDPDAAILITTMAESFKGGKRNVMMEKLNRALSQYCARLNIPLWDLFGITGGAGSSSYWLKSNLLQADKIHYQRKAYIMQGALLFDAIAHDYNAFVEQKAENPSAHRLAKIEDK